MAPDAFFSKPGAVFGKLCSRSLATHACSCAPLAHDQRLLLRENVFDVRLKCRILLENLGADGALLGRLDLAVGLDVVGLGEPAGAKGRSVLCAGLFASGQWARRTF